MVLPAPSSATTTLMRPGGGLPFFRPMMRLIVWPAGLLELLLAGLPRISTCSGSTPGALAVVQVTVWVELLSRLSTTSGAPAPAPVTHTSIWLLAPPLLGAPVI